MTGLCLNGRVIIINQLDTGGHAQKVQTVGCVSMHL